MRVKLMRIRDELHGGMLLINSYFIAMIASKEIGLLYGRNTARRMQLIMTLFDKQIQFICFNINSVFVKFRNLFK